jgi:dienelactone hydrolase
VFLHGIGEGGSDGTHCLTVGLGPAIAKRANDFPFIVIFPQSTGGWKEDSQAAKDAIAALHEAERDYSIDKDRVMLTGLSTGGYGTWAIGAVHREEFAALVPMCAYSAYNYVPDLKVMPIWCFHNGGDPFVGSGGSKEMCERINKEGGHAKYTQYSAFGHDCWNRAYNEGELFVWMQQQKRGAATATATPATMPSAPRRRRRAKKTSGEGVRSLETRRLPHPRRPRGFANTLSCPGTMTSAISYTSRNDSCACFTSYESGNTCCARK